MVSIKNAIKAMQAALELSGRAKALDALRTMDSRWLEENGFSIEALEQGISAWPWREAELVDQKSPAVTEISRNPANHPDHKIAA